MPLSLADILTSLQQGVQAINNLTIQIRTTFPQSGAISFTATTGGLVSNSSNPAAFLTIITSSGATYKVPLFNP